MNRLILLFIVLSLASCKCDSNESKIQASGNIDVGSELLKGVDIPAVLSARSELLPQMCDLVPVSYIAEILEVGPDAITPKNSTPGGGNPKSRTCFFKWEDPDFANTGIMMQAMRNPMIDEFPGYIPTYIESKRLNGEQLIAEETPYMFKELIGLGDEGVYSSDVGKYYWRFSDQVIFLLAFNTIHGHQKQRDIATKLAKRMTQEYLGLESSL